MLGKVAFKNLLRNPRRTLLIVVTVAIGTTSLLIFDGFNNGIMNQYRNNAIHARYGHGQINTVGYLTQPFEKPWEHWIEDAQRVQDKVGGIKGVTDVFPRIEFSALISHKNRTFSGRGIGVRGAVESKFFNTLNIIEGEDLNNQPDGVILGVGLARALDVKPGDHIQIATTTIDQQPKSQDFVVSGIFHLGTRELDDTHFRIQLDKAQGLLQTTRIETMALGLDSHEHWDDVAAHIHVLLPNLETTPFQVLDKIYYQHAVDWLGSQFAFIQLIIVFMVILGIFSTISFAVIERTSEIGNLRANGESKLDVLALLGLEGIFLGILGSILGILLSLAITHILLGQGMLMPPAPGLTRQYKVFIELRSQMAAQAFLIGTFCAVVAALVAGVKIVKLPIAEALRSR